MEMVERRGFMPKPTRILVVDDEIDTLELIELTLRTAGYVVQTVDNGRDALKAANKDSFDVIMLDIMMPDMSGFDVLRAMRENLDSVPPFIFLTASKRSSDQETGEDLGAVSYLVKPITRGRLLDVLEEALGEEIEADASS
jgi:DNA-binding response OmpR family regulator